MLGLALNDDLLPHFGRQLSQYLPLQSSDHDSVVYHVVELIWMLASVVLDGIGPGGFLRIAVPNPELLEVVVYIWPDDRQQVEDLLGFGQGGSTRKQKYSLSVLQERD